MTLTMLSRQEFPKQPVCSLLETALMVVNVAPFY
jgi:hypothetical protein